MRSARTTITAAAAVAAALAGTGTASAQDFCVNAPPGCQGVAVSSLTLASQLAVAQSNGSADRFIIGQGVVTGGPWAYNSAEKVEIVGAGAGKTTMLSTAAGIALTLRGSVDSSVSGLSIQPAGSASGGLYLEHASAAHVTVFQDPALSGLAWGGVVLESGARLDHSSVVTRHGYAVNADKGNVSITDSELSGTTFEAVYAGGDDITLRRVRIAAPGGVYVAHGHATIADSLLDLRSGTNAYGIYVGTGFTASGSSADVDGVTMVGQLGPATTMAGLVAEAATPGGIGTLRVRDTVVSGFREPLRRKASGGGTATIDLDWSAFADPLVPQQDSGAGAITVAHRVDAGPGFADAAGGDFHPAAGSPLLDAGDPAAPATGAIDLDGAPRAADGDADCVVRRDIGAFERQGACTPPAPAAPPAATPAPVVPAAAPAAVVPLTLSGLKARGRRVRFTVSRAATVTLRITGPHHVRRTLRVRAAGGRGAVTLPRLRAGRYRLTAVAVDAAGARSATARAVVRVAR